MRFLITGSAGFIGFHLAHHFLSQGHEVTGYDSLSPYYDINLKKARQNLLTKHKDYTFIHAALEDKTRLKATFEMCRPDVVLHLAAQAGVRYSIEAPQSYIDSNLIATFNLLECARYLKPKHVLMASSSSIYGANETLPFSEQHQTDNPLSLYAATKKAGEAMAHSYAHLFDLPITALRFFTVYGPWGRPDMALFKFTKAILEGQKIDIYNRGEMYRDLTYIDDLVTAISLLVNCIPPSPHNRPDAFRHDSLSAAAPYRTVNIGNNHRVKLIDFVSALEKVLRTQAKKNFMPMQAGDVQATWADTRLLKELTGYTPQTDIEKGIANFVHWYLDWI